MPLIDHDDDRAALFQCTGCPAGRIKRTHVCEPVTRI
jgi:hypothetical protein